MGRTIPKRTLADKARVQDSAACLLQAALLSVTGLSISVKDARSLARSTGKANPQEIVTLVLRSLATRGEGEEKK